MWFGFACPCCLVTPSVFPCTRRALEKRLWGIVAHCVPGHLEWPEFHASFGHEPLSGTRGGAVTQARGRVPPPGTRFGRCGRTADVRSAASL